MIATRPLAVGITPMETRREVILHVATVAEELGYTAFFLAEGWAGDASVQLAEIALKTSRSGGTRPARRCPSSCCHRTGRSTSSRTCSTNSATPRPAEQAWGSLGPFDEANDAVEHDVEPCP